jgi:hypothetical protein
MINLSSFIAFHARRTPDRVALKYRGEDVSYAEFERRIRLAGGWLASQGIGAGDVVAVLMKNSTAFFELVFAASHIGAVFLPINFRLSADEVGYIVGNSGAKLLIADEELSAIAAGGAPVVLLDEAAQISITHLAPDAVPAPSVESEKLAALQTDEPPVEAIKPDTAATAEPTPPTEAPPVQAETPAAAEEVKVAAVEKADPAGPVEAAPVELAPVVASPAAEKDEAANAPAAVPASESQREAMQSAALVSAAATVAEPASAKPNSAETDKAAARKRRAQRAKEREL